MTLPSRKFLDLISNQSHAILISFPNSILHQGQSIVQELIAGSATDIETIAQVVGLAIAEIQSLRNE